MLRGLLLLALAGLAVLSFASWFGEFAEPADLLSHLRVHFAVAAGLLLLALMLAREFWAAAVAGLLVAANLAGSLVYPHVGAGGGALAGGRDLTLFAFNVRWSSDNADRIVAHLRATQPDFVVLQEMPRDKVQAMLPALADLYPWQVACPDDIYCRLALLSRHRWENAEAARHGEAGVAAAVADFGPAFGSLRLIGLHLPRPWPWWEGHARHAADLLPLARAGARPVIMAGDFNATPWSRTVRSIGAGTGLLPAGSYRPTWPVRTARLGDIAMPPQLQIDHVLLPRGVTLVAVATGPDLGSDHLPIAARIAVPAVR